MGNKVPNLFSPTIETQCPVRVRVNELRSSPYQSGQLILNGPLGPIKNVLSCDKPLQRTEQQKNTDQNASRGNYVSRDATSPVILQKMRCKPKDANNHE
jgi:hypothetical protein